MSMDSYLDNIKTKYEIDQKLPIVFSKEYDISFYGLEKLHPFDAKKYGRIYNFLIKDKVITPDQIVSPDEISYEDLRLVHTESYLESLKQKKVISGILEIPILYFVPNFIINSCVLKPMRYQTGGTVLASYISLIKGWAINIGGGFHHASCDCGGGFCVYADISLAIHKLRENGLIDRAMIIDLDAHQGNGHETDFRDDKNTFIIDAFNPNIYPGDQYAFNGISEHIYVYPTTTDKKYLKDIKRVTDSSIKKFKPDIIIYNAGTDCLEGDPLGNLNISAEGIIKRDEIIFELGLKYNVPVTMVLSGGYQMNNARIIANSITNILNIVNK